MPDWLDLVVTRRPEFDVKTLLQALNLFPLDTESESNLADIREEQQKTATICFAAVFGMNEGQTMSVFFLAIAPILFGALAAYVRVGQSGPVYERRYGILTFPDCLWTIPLFLTLASFWLKKWTFVPRFSCFFYLALCSFAMCILVAVAYSLFSKWTQLLPSHMKPLTYARLRASRYRMLVRTALWQGVLAGALDGTTVRPAWVLAVPGYIYLLAALPFLMAVLVRARYRTRYGRTCYQDDRRAFDVFVSYRSQNVEAARRFADMALTNNLKTWFAEYLIRFHSRDRFIKAINHGITTSRTGIIFTGCGYFESPHCLGEIQQLVEKNGCSGILEVYSPGSNTTANWCDQWEKDEDLQKREETRWVAKYLADLRQIPSVSVLDQEGLLKAAREVLQLEIDDRFVIVPGTKSEIRFRGEHTGVPFSLETAGWQEVPTPGAGSVMNPDLRITPGFKCDFGFGNVVWEIVLGPVVRRMHDLMYEEIPPADDDNRWLYNEYRDTAMIWLAENAAECLGVQLFWLAPRDRRPHFLLTHWGERMWHRRYTIVLEHESLKEPATFSFAFYYEGPFEDYCRHTPLMDAVVRSLRWEKRR